MSEEELLSKTEPLPKQNLNQEELSSPTSEEKVINQTEQPSSVQENSNSLLELQFSDLRIKLQIGFAFLTFVLLGANDAAIGVLLPHWGSYYNVDKAMLSLVFFAGSLGYLVAALNSNFLFRKLGNVKFLSLGKAAFLSGVIIFCFQPPLYLILTVPFLLGFGAAILEAALNAHLTKFPNKSVLLNYLHSFYGVGALLSPFLASQILEADWRWSVIYFGISALSLILLISMRWLFTSADRGNSNSDSENTPVESPLRYRFVWLFAFFLLFYAGAEISLGNWSYSFLTQYRHEDNVLAGWLMSGYWFGLTVGRVCIGPLTNKLGTRKIINLCLVGVMIGVFTLIFMSFSITSAFGLLLTGFCLGPILPTALAFLSNIIPSYLLTGAISFIASLGSLGKAFFPWIAGNIADNLGLEMFLPYIIVLTALMITLWALILARENQSYANS
ncbi:MFS transporter [Euhalothece natronophila Z-M001]|uniref:MFS transporter n=1 Tax=Euhalothece natronophila Z-M001 TaxID=522448 RepID=A0A5B8NIH3_9CHRO|nr:MFS transporter [Euhalothece natronophila]QDZ39033.1 MFS transporter [Euhalothece natronophila Z-M001]